MPVFKTAFNGYSIKFSPFDDRVAVGTSQNFGIIGNGKQYVLQVTPAACSHTCAIKSMLSNQPLLAQGAGGMRDPVA